MVRTGLTESELVTLSLEGDAEAFAELIRRTRPMCYRTALSILRDPVEVEDELQSAYFKAWRQLGTFRQDARFSTWMTRIVSNQCLMRLRERKRSAWRSGSLEIVSHDGEQPRMADAKDSAVTPEQAVGESQVAALVRREMQRLPGLMRAIMELVDAGRMPLADAAERLGITVPAAKSRLGRARQELRKRMEPHLGRLGLATLTQS